MKQLEISSDAHAEEEMDHDQEQDQSVPAPGVPLPEEVDLSESNSSPTDSGFGTSIDGLEIVKEELRTGVADDSDADPDYTPRRPSRTSRSRGNTKRLSRRTSSTSSGTPLLDASARIEKPSVKRQGSQSTVKGEKSGRRQTSTSKKSSGLGYTCRFHRYGCSRAKFANKNEWKRHNLTQHLQLGLYLCDMGSCADNSTRHRHEYNRKDLFVSHCRRMHAPWSKTIPDYASVPQRQKNAYDEKLKGILKRCWHKGNDAPQKLTCGFCDATFVESGRSTDGQNPGKAWEECMDHLGKHVDRNGYDVADEKLDVNLHRWALNHGVIVKIEGTDHEYRLVGYDSQIGSMGRRKSSKRATTAGSSSRSFRSEDEDEDDTHDDNGDDGEEDEEEDNSDIKTESEDDDDNTKMDLDDDEDEDAEGEYE